MPPPGTPGHRRGCRGHRTDEPDRRSPIGAAWSGSSVPAPRPRSAVGHGASVFTGDLLAFQPLRCELAAPLRHVAGFPDLGLLRGSVPSRGHQPTTGLPATGLAGRRGGRPRDGSHVHHCTGRRGRCPALPRQPRHEYAADLPRGLRRRPTYDRRRSRPPGPLVGRALLPGPYPPGWSRCSRLRGFHHWFLHSYTFSVSLAGPGPSGSADPSRRCRGCSHPPLRLRVRLPPASPAAATARQVGPFISARSDGASWRTRW